jgi:hypothetical protein
MKDAAELIAGTDPGQASSVWRCAVAKDGEGFSLNWASLSGRWYSVERTYNLTDGFSVIASNLPATPPQNSYSDDAGSNAFYRIGVRE